MAWIFLGALAVSGAAWLTKRALGKYVNSPNAARFWRNVEQNYSNWQHHAGIPNSTKMDTTEALQILGLDQQKVTEQSIKEAHKKLLMANHPDKGGSSYLAAKINQARDVLLKNR